MLRRTAAAILLLSTLPLASAASAAVDPKVPLEPISISSAYVKLTFPRSVDVSQSTVVIQGVSGNVPTGSLEQGVEGELIILLPADLSPGEYEVHFVVRGSKGYLNQGSVPITVPSLDSPLREQIPSAELLGVR